MHKNDKSNGKPKQEKLFIDIQKILQKKDNMQNNQTEKERRKLQEPTTKTLVLSLFAPECHESYPSS